MGLYTGPMTDSRRIDAIFKLANIAHGKSLADYDVAEAAIAGGYLDDPQANLTTVISQTMHHDLLAYCSGERARRRADKLRSVSGIRSIIRAIVALKGKKIDPPATEPTPSGEA